MNSIYKKEVTARLRLGATWRDRTPGWPRHSSVKARISPFWQAVLSPLAGYRRAESVALAYRSGHNHRMTASLLKTRSDSQITSRLPNPLVLECSRIHETVRILYVCRSSVLTRNNRQYRLAARPAPRNSTGKIITENGSDLVSA